MKNKTLEELQELSESLEHDFNFDGLDKFEKKSNREEMKKIGAEIARRFEEEASGQGYLSDEGTFIRQYIENDTGYYVEVYRHDNGEEFEIVQDNDGGEEMRDV
ncbi:MAG: hypothetical protein ACPGJV_02600 [Bacteriovoracaceae bacterium]